MTFWRAPGRESQITSVSCFEGWSWIFQVPVKPRIYKVLNEWMWYFVGPYPYNW